MTLSANAAASPRAPEGIQRALWPKVLALAVLAIVPSQYFGACVLLGLLHQDLREAGPLTLLRYALYYGDRPEIRSRLWIASFAGLAGVALVPLSFLLPRRRALHGDARFASRLGGAGARVVGCRGI